MTEQEIETLHTANRTALFFNKNEMEIQEILFKRAQKITSDLIIEGFVPHEIQLMLGEIMKTYNIILKKLKETK